MKIIKNKYIHQITSKPWWMQDTYNRFNYKKNQQQLEIQLKDLCKGLLGFYMPLLLI